MVQVLLRYPSYDSTALMHLVQMEYSFELVLVDILITRFEGMGVCISAGITCKYSRLRFRRRVCP